MFLAALLGLPLPLLPIQILWVNLVTDGLPAMALGVDPIDPDVMRRPPRPPGESVFSRGLSRKIISRGLQIGLSTLGVFCYGYLMLDDLPLARTMAFCTLVCCQLFHVYDCRSKILTIFEIGFFSNKYLVLATGCSLLMLLAVLYLPGLQSIFSTVPLTLADCVVIIVVAGWTMLVGAFRHFAWHWRREVRTAWSKVK